MRVAIIEGDLFIGGIGKCVIDVAKIDGPLMDGVYLLELNRSYCTLSSSDWPQVNLILNLDMIKVNYIWSKLLSADPINPSSQFNNYICGTDIRSPRVDEQMIDLGIQNKGIMQQSAKIQGQNEEPAFVKGMTLQEYMASPVFDHPDQPNLQDRSEENLYQSSHYGQLEQVYSKKRNYRIDQIDEESIEDSKDYRNDYEDRETPAFQQKPNQPHNTITQTIEETSHPKARANSISRSTAITFKPTQEPNHFRIKRLSVSPQKKKVEAFNNGSITLYGSKFGYIPKTTTKIPEMLTFYGKLRHETGEQILNRKSSIKQSGSKQRFSKKGQFQLHKVLQFQNPLKLSNPSGHKQHGFQDLKVEGHREGMGHRKQKLV